MKLAVPSALDKAFDSGQYQILRILKKLMLIWNYKSCL